MPYNQFTLPDLQRDFGLVVDDGTDLYRDVEEIDLPPTLASTLERYLPLAASSRTEKGRSEMLIAPVLIELKLRHDRQVAVFSGITFDVDEAAGLRGRCDFILSSNPYQLELLAPVCVIVEAKGEDIAAGVPQCLAGLVAAQRFNARAGLPPRVLHGIVSTGIQWRFLRLDGVHAQVDREEYLIRQPRKIFAILTHAVLGIP